MRIFRLNLSRVLYFRFDPALSYREAMSKRFIRRLEKGEILIVVEGPIVEQANDMIEAEHWFVVVTTTGETGMIGYQPLNENGPLFRDEFLP